jgi:hypothetical protein
MLSASGRRLTPFLCEQARCFVTATTQMAAAPAVIETKPQSGGFLSSLFGSSRSTVPMTEPFPGVVLPEPQAIGSARPSTEQTTLPNGIRIASEATPVSSAYLVYKPENRVVEEPCCSFGS